MTGGQETMLINIANEQAKCHDIIVMIINEDYDNNLVKLFDSRVKVVCVGRPRSSKNPWYLMKLNIMIYKLCPDVVHSHYEKQVQYLINYGYKFVYTIHGFTISPRYLQKNRNLVAISRGISEDVKKRVGIDSTVIYNGIHVADIKQKNKVCGYSRNREFKIVQVSRLFHEVKGQDVLIKAVASLKKRGYTNISLDFIGDGASLNYLQTLTCDLQLHNVRFLGTKSVDYIKNNICDYDLFVQASRHEGFGLTVAEAMAAKLPVLVSECDGLLEVVGNGAYSFVFKNSSIEDCAERIEEVLNTSPDIIQDKVDKAWMYVNENFSVKRTADNYINFYESCE